MQHLLEIYIFALFATVCCIGDKCTIYIIALFATVRCTGDKCTVSIFALFAVVHCIRDRLLKCFFNICFFVHLKKKNHCLFLGYCSDGKLWSELWFVPWKSACTAVWMAETANIPRHCCFSSNISSIPVCNKMSSNESFCFSTTVWGPFCWRPFWGGTKMGRTDSPTGKGFRWAAVDDNDEFNVLRCWADMLGTVGGGLNHSAVTEDIPLVEFMYIVFTRTPGESYHRRLGSLLLYLCYVFRALINSLVCWFILMLFKLKGGWEVGSGPGGGGGEQDRDTVCNSPV